MASLSLLLVLLIFSPFQVSALFEIATLEHFLRPPINYEAAENAYACNDIPPTEYGAISYIIIRKTNVHPRVIAFYRSNDPFTAACAETNLVMIVSFFPEANTQQVVMTSGFEITHWKALSTISPEWDIYRDSRMEPGQKLQHSSMPPFEWWTYDGAVSVQNYDYDWENIENRRRDNWQGNDIYPRSERDSMPESEDESEDELESGSEEFDIFDEMMRFFTNDDEDNSDAGSDPNDFRFDTESIENHSDDTGRTEGLPDNADERNLYDIVIESTPARWPMEIEPAPNSEAQSSPDRSNPEPQLLQNRPNRNNRLPGGGLIGWLPNLRNPVPQVYNPEAFIQIEARLRAQARNREMQRTSEYVPLGPFDRDRPRDLVLSQGFYVDSGREDAERARRTGANEARVAEISGSREGSPTTIEEEENPEQADLQAQVQVPPSGNLPPVDINPGPPIEDTSPFLGYQPGGYTGDVDKFFDFKS
ncbi:hypothetical protein TWF506_005759 [Arthrobotrys conoides]|uniref:Uncharacterized protein n=1 Tax=Arthrobotrys conoides TaxID=74498 RepID=A0AAN8S0C8_9PEZI